MESAATSRLTNIVRKAVHDIRGPVINVRGFSDQLSDAVEELLVLLDSKSSDLPDVIRDRVAEIVEQDVTPGLIHLRAALLQLDTRIDRVMPESISAIEDLK